MFSDNFYSTAFHKLFASTAICSLFVIQKKNWVLGENLNNLLDIYSALQKQEKIVIFKQQKMEQNLSFKMASLK